jgi:hypothetical protein
VIWHSDPSFPKSYVNLSKPHQSILLSQALRSTILVSRTLSSPYISYHVSLSIRAPFPPLRHPGPPISPHLPRSPLHPQTTPHFLNTTPKLFHGIPHPCLHLDAPLHTAVPPNRQCQHSALVLHRPRTRLHSRPTRVLAKHRCSNGMDTSHTRRASQS